MTNIKRLAIGTDSRGEAMARQVVGILEALGIEVLVLSADCQDTAVTKDDPSPETTDIRENDAADDNEVTMAGSHDYPEEAWRVANAVAREEVDAGVLVSGSAIGMCITANKCPGIRAVVAYDEWVVRRSRAHHNCNILCIPADLLGHTNLRTLFEIWLNTPFDAGHHQRRVDKIALVERGEAPADHPVNS